MDSPKRNRKGKIRGGSNRDKDPVPPPPPPPMPTSLPTCSQHSVNRTPPIESPESPPVNIVVEEEIKEVPSRKPYFDSINFERPRLIRRDADKLSRLFSGMYARIIVVFTIAFVLTEILNKTYSPYFFQGFLFLYLFGVSILCMMIIYCYLLRMRLKDSNEVMKRRRTGIPEISIYLRAGALIFGLGTLLFNGLEVAIVFMTEKRCTNMLGMALPVLQAFFTFVQMYFIFTDCRRALKNLGWFSWFAMSHLAATNLAVWVRIVVMETANDWMHHFQLMRSNMQSSMVDSGEYGQQFLNSTVSPVESTIDDAMKLFICLKNSTLGNVWEDALPYLYPFIIKFSWLGCAIFYSIRTSLRSKYGSNTDDGYSLMSRRVKSDTGTTLTKTGRRYYFKIDCRGSSKGLFSGLLLLIGNIIVIVLFFVLRSKKKFEQEIYMATLGSYGVILLIGIFVILIGYFVIRNHLVESFYRKNKIDEMLTTVNLSGLCLLCAFCLIVSSTDIFNPLKMIMVANSCLTILQAALQEMFINEMSGRKSTSDTDLGFFSKSRPGRQVTTFLLFLNIILWLYDTFITYIVIMNTVQMHIVFISSFPWGLVFRVCLPLLIFYRFHSAVRLMGLWKSSYEK